MLFSDWIWPKHRNTWIWLWQSECMPPQPFNFYCVSNDVAGQAISRILQQDVFLVFSKKTRSNWTPNDSFGFCSSRGFCVIPYIPNLILAKIFKVKDKAEFPKSQFKNMNLSTHKDLNQMVSIVFNLKYLSQNIIKFGM